MKRIVFINRFYRPDHSATAQLLTDLAETLAADGHRVSIVTSRQTYDDPHSRLPRRETLSGVEIHRIWTSRFGRVHLPGRTIDYLSFYCSALLHLLRNLRRGDTVIAKTDPPLISLVAAIAARIKGATLINWLQDLFPEVACKLGVIDAKNPAFRLLRSIRDSTLRAASTNIVIGERMAAAIRDIAGENTMTRVIPNWPIQPLLTQEEQDDNPLRREWQLHDKFVVAYSGNLGRAHEFRTILDAAERLRDREDIVFLFIGAGAQMQPAREFAASRQLRNVVFKPYQPLSRLACSLAAADVHLVSLQPELEGLIVPSKFYGIIAVHRPVLFIGAADGELTRLIETHGCGFAVRPGDGAALANHIEKLHSHESRWRETAAASAALATTRLNRGAALSEWRKVVA